MIWILVKWKEWKAPKSFRWISRALVFFTKYLSLSYPIAIYMTFFYLLHIYLCVYIYIYLKKITFFIGTSLLVMWRSYYCHNITTSSLLWFFTFFAYFGLACYLTSQIRWIERKKERNEKERERGKKKKKTGESERQWKPVKRANLGNVGPTYFSFGPRQASGKWGDADGSPANNRYYFLLFIFFGMN